jgi:hypothetical protein
MTTRRGFGLSEVIIIILVCVLAWIFLLRLRDELMKDYRGTRCATNLKAIGTGVVTYKAANKERAPVMRDRPTFDASVNVSPMSTTGCDEMYGMNEDGTTEDWSALGDNAMQNVWLMIASAVVKERAFQCPLDKDYQPRSATYRFGWTSPYEYSYSTHWPYAESAGGDANPAPFNAQLDGRIVLFADHNPGPLDPEGRGHAKHGPNVLRADGSGDWGAKRSTTPTGIDGDEIYTNAAGVVGGIPQNEYDTSLNLSPRPARTGGTTP